MDGELKTEKVDAEEEFATGTEASGGDDGRVQAQAWYHVRDMRLSGEEGFQLDSPNDGRVRLGFVLEESKARAECILRPAQKVKSALPTRAVVFVPPEHSASICIDHGGSLRLGGLVIRPAAISERLGQVIGNEALYESRRNIANDRIWQLGAQLARESAQPDSFSRLACDSLVTLLLVQFFRTPSEGANSRLSPAQLRRVSEFIEANLARRIGLADLAALVGLSLSHFSHAFKAATGMPPHRWQLAARIRHSQTLLLSNHCSLSDVAAAAGFADQSHFTRVFHRFVGATPGKWRQAKSAH